MLELSRRRFAETTEDVSLRIGELEHLPLRDGEGDFACINMVLHHLSEPLPALREIRRVLRPAGILLITDFDRHDQEEMRDAYGDLWLGFDRDALCALLRQAGFAPETCRRHPVEHGLAVNMITARNTAPIQQLRICKKITCNY
jgi:ArsR family transcriptional regulator